MFHIEADTEKTQLADSELAFMGLLKHGRVQSAAQLSWSILDIVKQIELIQLDTPVRVRFAGTRLATDRASEGASLPSQDRRPWDHDVSRTRTPWSCGFQEEEEVEQLKRGICFH